MALKSFYFDVYFQGCISSCFGALQDLRKVKVSEMVQQKGQKVVNTITSAAVSENQAEAVLETVIGREENIQKSALDTYSYR